MIEDWFIDWIKKHEGFRAKAYLDKGQYSIGYGSATMPNGELVKAGDVITEKEAAKLIPQYIKRVEADIKKIHPKYDSYPQHVKYALIDQAYQGGLSALKKSPKFNYALQSALSDNKITIKELEKIIKEMEIDTPDKDGNLLPGVQNRKRRRAALIAGVYDPAKNYQIGDNNTVYKTFDKDFSNPNTVWGQVVRLYNNPTQNWVQRAITNPKESIPDWESKGAKTSTHKLAYAETGDGVDILFPLVQQKIYTPRKWLFFKGDPVYTKGLIDYTDPKNMDADPYEIAVQMGDTVQVPSGLGSLFSTTYKEYFPFEQFKKGGVLNYINFFN